MTQTPLPPRRPLLALARLIAFLLVCVAHGTRHALTRPRAGAERLAASQHATGRWARGCARALGIAVTVEGTPPTGPALLAPNHVLYGDILAVASVVPCFFLSKAEVARWPLVGWLFRISDQCASTRRRSRELAESGSTIGDRLRAGTRVAVFLEGTTTDGERLLPFGPSFIQPAVDAQVPVVPVALRWTCDEADVVPARDLAWTRGAPIGPHVRRLMGLRGVRAHVTFGTPIDTTGRARREVAALAQEEVRRLLGGVPLLAGAERDEWVSAVAASASG